MERNHTLASNSTALQKPTEDAHAGESSTFKAAKLSLYGIIFLVSVVGNSLVCVVITRRRRMRTVTNLFVLNLAISDLAITCICIPFDIPVQENIYRWPYGGFLCKILYPLQTLAMFASIFTLTAVSANRFWAIIYPLRKQMSKVHATATIIAIWLLCVLLTVPYMLVLRLDAETRQCVEEWPGTRYRKIYTASLFVLQYLLPLTVITVAYLGIGLELRTSTVGKNTPTLHAVLDKAHRNEARKVVRMLIVVTLLFAICVLPNNVMWLWLDFGSGGEYEHFWDVVAVTNIVLFANSAANPVAYTICHEKFREEFKLYITCDFKTLREVVESTATFTRNRFRSVSVGNEHENLATVTCRELLIVHSKETVI